MRNNTNELASQEDYDMQTEERNSEEEDMECRRKALKLRVTLLEKALDRANPEELEERMTDIKTVIIELESSDYLLHPNSESIQATIEEATRTCEHISGALKVGKAAHSSQNSISAVTSYQSSRDDDPFKIKPLALPTFDGAYEEWLPFWETFRAVVHEKNHYSAVAKHRMLLNCLRGEAKRAVAGVNPTGDNYETETVKTLKERFGDPAKLASTYYAKLERLPRALEPSKQRSTYDEIRKILANLTTLGTPIDEEYLKERIIKKFNFSTLKWVWSNLGFGRAASVQQLMEALSKIVSRDDDIAHYFRDEKSALTQSSFSTPVVAASVVTARQNCKYCDGRHQTQDCRRFGTMAKRKERLIQLNKCLMCGDNSHKAARCDQRSTPCSHCKKKGHQIINCIEYLLNNKASGEKSHTLNTTLALDVDTFTLDKALETFALGFQTFLETFICKVKSAGGQYVEVRGILDGGSCRSFILENLVKRLQLEKGRRTLAQICSFGSKNIISQKSCEVTAVLTNAAGQEMKLTLQTFPRIIGDASMTPAAVVVQKFLPKNLKYADSSIFSTKYKPVEILIGNDYYNQVVDLTHIKQILPGLVLKNSFFGWIPSGPLGNNEEISLKNTRISNTSDLVLSAVLANKQPLLVNVSGADKEDLCPFYWSLETLGISENENNDINDDVIKYFRETTKVINNRFEVRWPWKTHQPSLGPNNRVSIARLKKVLENSNEEMLQKCEENIKSQLSLGIIEEAPKHTPFLKHYIPWKPIIQKGKIRIVYDASAKSSTGNSLNDLLHVGPKLIGDLFGLLLNFRTHKVALSADIEKAFLQISLNEVDRDVVRFFWVKNTKLPLTPENLLVYRFTRVPFGVISSPFLLNMVVHEALTSQNKWLTLSRKCFYVDNLVLSVKDTSEALNLHGTLNPRLAAFSFNLRDWTSNDPDTVAAISHSLPINSEPMSVLGVNWNRAEDTLSLKINWTTDKTYATKRIILKHTASIFDPYGFFIPVTLPFKLLVQECWKQKYSWDEILPAQLQARWSKLLHDNAEDINKGWARRYWEFDQPGQIDLHIFCDASGDAYACSAYATYTNKDLGLFHSSLLCSKSKLSPPKKLTIPRLELLGIFIGKKLAIQVITQMWSLTFDNLIIWTDATTVLHWLNSNSLQPTFIQNRINEIKKPLNQNLTIRNKNFTIRYVPTEHNPADIATRGMTTKKLFQSTLWWNGPSWLQHPQLWPKPPVSVENFSAQPSSIFPMMLIHENIENTLLSDAFERRFSSWDKYARLYGYVLRFCANAINIPDNDSDTDIFQRGERALIRALQQKYFSKELKLLKKNIQPNAQLELFVDQLNMIRCKGRLQNASFPWQTIHPILLPRNSPITEIYVRKVHCENGHFGCDHVLAKVREKFWICKGRAKVKSVIHKCVVCKLWSGGSYQLPNMPPLPWVRVTEAAPFLHCGLDYLGPLNMLTDSGETKDAYILLVSCLVTRAVHLELVRDLSADEFLMAFIRFTSRRGVPLFVLSDNASNFNFVQPLVGQKIHFTHTGIRNFFSSNNIQWKNIPQYSPWQGGAYERMVALVKNCLKKSFGRKQVLNYVALNTALCEIENIINSRPLTYVSEENILPLTPNHFLRLRTCNANNFVEVSQHRIRKSTRKEILKQWEDSSALVENFWCAFRSLYLLSLRERHSAVHKKKKGSVAFAPKIGDIVLIKHPSAPRADWTYGKITELDKRQALARVFTNGNTITRSINHLYPFELSERPESSENYAIYTR